MSANPYELTSVASAPDTLVEPTVSLSGKLGMFQSRRRLAVILLIGSIAALAWMWGGGLITYAPGAVAPNDMQNIYLSRILVYGLLSGVLQIAAIALIVTQSRSTHDARTVAEQSGEREPPMTRVLKS